MMYHSNNDEEMHMRANWIESCLLQIHEWDTHKKVPSVSILLYETISLEECIFAVSMTIVWLSSTYSISRYWRRKSTCKKKTCFVHTSRSLKLNHLTKLLTWSSEKRKFEQRFTKFPKEDDQFWEVFHLWLRKTLS